MYARNHVTRSLANACLSAAFMFAFGAGPCLALTAKDITEKMSKDERSGYLAGLIDMRAFQAAQSGDATLSKCINDAYYRNIGGENDLWPKLQQAFDQFPDKQAATIVFVLLKKTCGG